MTTWLKKLLANLTKELPQKLMTPNWKKCLSSRFFLNKTVKIEKIIFRLLITIITDITKKLRELWQIQQLWQFRELWHLQQTPKTTTTQKTPTTPKNSDNYQKVKSLNTMQLNQNTIRWQNSDNSDGVQGGGGVGGKMKYILEIETKKEEYTTQTNELRR